MASLLCFALESIVVMLDGRRGRGFEAQKLTKLSVNPTFQLLSSWRLAQATPSLNHSLRVTFKIMIR